MEGPKKQIPLRLSPALHDELAAWAADEFRSLNGQIEYLLTECVRARVKNGGHLPDSLKATREAKTE